MRQRRPKRTRIVVLRIAIPAVMIAVFGIYLASIAGELLAREAPTRVPVTPFAGIPGFTVPTPASSPDPSPIS